MRLTLQSLFNPQAFTIQPSLVVLIGSDAALLNVLAEECFPKLERLEENFLKEKGVFWSEPGLFDEITKPLGYLIEDVSEALFTQYPFLKKPDSLLVTWSTSLRSTSSLIKECQTSTTMHQISCYELSAYDEKKLLQESLKHRNLTLMPGEIPRIPYTRWYDTCEKLTLKTYDTQRVVGQHIQDILADHREVLLTKLIYAFSQPHRSEALELLISACHEVSLEPLLILRALLRHFLQLKSFRTALDEGESSDRALIRVSPPVFFKEASHFKVCGIMWHVQDLQEALALLWKAERALKRSADTWEWCYSLYELWRKGCGVNARKLTS